MTDPNISDLLRSIDLPEVEPGRYRSEARDDGWRPVVEGSQLLGQSVVAAMRAAHGRRVVSAAMAFTRAASTTSTYDLELDIVADGRTFTGLQHRVVQNEKVCAIGMMLLDVTAPDFINHADVPPVSAGPDDSAPLDMRMTGREIRIVDNAYTGDPDAPVGPPVIDAWVRLRDLPDDQAILAGLLCEFMGSMPIAAAMRPHAGIGQNDAHRTISTAVNAITVSIHTDVPTDQWLRYHHRSTYAGQGMTHAECSVVTEGGERVASFTVDAMVRGFADPTKVQDAKTAF